jgi:hypothetical protein
VDAGAPLILRFVSRLVGLVAIRIAIRVFF